MGIKLLRALVLLALFPGSLLAQAPPTPSEATPPTQSPSRKPTPQSPFSVADSAIDAVASGMVELRKCFVLVSRLEKDLAAKKKDIQSQYEGRIPPSYRNLLMMKANRINVKRNLCYTMMNVEVFDRATNALRGVEPKSIPGFEERKDRLAELRSTYNEMVKGRGGATSADQ